MNFIHVPKTGGTSIESKLTAKTAVFHRFKYPNTASPWHFPPDLFEARFKQPFPAPRFCVIRDPADRYASCQAWSKWSFRLSANEIARQALEWRHVHEELLHRMPQHMFVFSRNGSLQCECVVAFEKIGLLFAAQPVVMNNVTHSPSDVLPKDFADLYRFDTILHRAARSSPNICFRPAAYAAAYATAS